MQKFYSYILLTLFVTGCVTPKDTLLRDEAKTLQGVTVKFSHIALPTHGYFHEQSAAGLLWFANGGLSGFHETIKVDPKSHQITTLSRPWTAGFADLLVNEDSYWFSDGMARFNGSGILRRYDIQTDQLTAAVESVGSPFAFGDGAIWAYNPRSRVVSGINISDNKIRTQIDLVPKVWGINESFTFGNGSVWQLNYLDAVNELPVVRRIDPETHHVLAEIPIEYTVQNSGLDFKPLSFINNSIWVVGRNYRSEPFAIRIDTKINRVVANIPLFTGKENFCSNAFPKSPVFFQNGIWISIYCSNGLLPVVLLKIDPKTNLIVDQLHLPLSGLGPYGMRLSVLDNALWGVDERNLYRIDFLPHD
ncbi:MAG: hypothetical protein PHI29_08040 [Gallionella sp.]|nr:hypothetical protein [Gallionella sp.]